MKKVLILSIDGGGIRGIIPGVILAELERLLQERSGIQRKIGEYFDFIAGTSTGGILSCLYLLPGKDGEARYFARDAVGLYTLNGEKIFRPKILENILSLFGPKYSDEILEKYLLEYFGNTELRQLIRPCLITAYEITDRRAYFFTSVNAVDPFRNFKVRSVARATSAAPTYFKPASVYSTEGQRFTFVDGGVFANNPALCAYAEARKMDFSGLDSLREKPDKPSAKDMIIISIGTGSVRKQYHYADFESAGEIKWMVPVIDILMSGNSETVNYQLVKMYETLSGTDRGNYYRLEPSLFEARPEMDLASPENIENLKQAALLYVEKNKEQLEEIVDKIIVNLAVKGP